MILKYSNIQLHYKSVSIVEKRKLICSMYPKNLCFDGRGHRTPHLSEPLALILQINKQLRSIKKGEKLSFDNLSPLVPSNYLITSTAPRIGSNSIQSGESEWASHATFSLKKQNFRIYIKICVPYLTRNSPYGDSTKSRIAFMGSSSFWQTANLFAYWA